MKKTIIKVGEYTIESDGSVDIEIDGSIIRVKGVPPTVVTFPTEPYRPMEPVYPKRYPTTGDHPWIPGPTWMSTSGHTTEGKNFQISSVKS